MLRIRRLTIAAALLAPIAARAQVPSGWQAVIDGSGDYTVRSDGSRRDGGQGFAGATIKANVESPRGSAMLAQSIRADAYRGKRVRLSGYLKTIGVNEGTAVLFMRIDGDGIVQTSDYMQNRPLMLTTIGLARRSSSTCRAPPSASPTASCSADRVRPGSTTSQSMS